LIAVITTVLVEVEMMSSSLPAADSKYPVPEAVGNLVLKLLAVFFGPVINVVVGRLAYKRGESWGGWIAGFGVAVWVVTIGGLTPFSR
jgi:hypothetical protein